MTAADPASGASAYFSDPQSALDPSLFAADGTLHPYVRDYILDALYGFFRSAGIQIGTWLHAWLAGSGASYQWKASRGNRDLDVLLGLDPVLFAALNPGFGDTSRLQLAGVLNEQLKRYLWPQTAAARLGDSTYEVTYYWNPRVSTDVTVIRPYAAWNLDASRWDVPPSRYPATGSFPPGWHDEARKHADRVLDLYGQWSQYLHDVLLLPDVSPSRASAHAGLQRVTAELRSIWDTLHDGRQSAFTGDGDGWADIHNYLWQAAKADGTTALLREVIREDNQRRTAEQTRLYGAPIDPADIALRRASGSYARWNQARLGQP